MLIAFHAFHSSHAAYYSHHHASGGNWFMHMIMSGVVHAAIYHMMAPLFRGHGLFGSIVIGLLIIGAVYLVYKFLNRPRYA
jgi:uncharacterized membrane protein YagU involved in acid resistance